MFSSGKLLIMVDKWMGFIRRVALTLLRISEKGVADHEIRYLMMMVRLYHEIRDVPGHIVEVGVADGRNAVIFGRLIKLSGDRGVRQYLGFDTFNGYLDRDLARNFSLNSSSFRGISIDSVKDRCNRSDLHGVVEFVQGDAKLSVEKKMREGGIRFRPGKAVIAMVYVDCNTYIPAKAALEACFPHMVPGSLIVVDEKIQGDETQALVDFCSENQLRVKRLGGVDSPLLAIVEE